MAFEMKDRLSQLKHSGVRSDDYVVDDPALEEGEEQGFLLGFFQTVDDLARCINEIALDVDKIKHNHNVILASVQNQEAKDETNQVMNEVKKVSHKVHGGLKRLKQEIDSEEQGPNRNTADFRIKKAQYATLSRKFHDVMSEYNQVQEDYRDKCKERIQRQLKYTGKRVTEDEVEDMLESDNPAIFTQDILIDTAQKRKALGEIEARHQEILQLEENIRELHEMFYDMALLVEEQGEMINRIEHNVETAAVHVDQGKREIRTAVQFQRKNRRLKWIICCVVTSVVVVIIVAIAIIVLIVLANMGVI